MHKAQIKMYKQLDKKNCVHLLSILVYLQCSSESPISDNTARTLSFSKLLAPNLFYIPGSGNPLGKWFNFYIKQCYAYIHEKKIRAIYTSYSYMHMGFIWVDITRVNLEEHGIQVGSVRYSPVNQGRRDSTKSEYSMVSSLLQSTLVCMYTFRMCNKLFVFLARNH